MPWRQPRLARSHPDGIVDLSVGTPVDPVPQVVTDALAAAANSPGYPMTAGTRALREAAAGWLARRHEVVIGPDADPARDRHQGADRMAADTARAAAPADVVAYPDLAYPTYDVGARLAGAPAGARPTT